jgi:uncharacterized protein DUF4149
MQRALSTTLVLAWGLWFGAIVMVFVTVMSLFATFPDQPAVAGAGAAGVFRRFEVLQLFAGGVALLSVIVLKARHPRSKPVTALTALLTLAALGAVSSTLLLTPRIDDLRQQGVPSSSAQFKSLHRASSLVYTSQAVVLLAAGLVLPSVIARPRTDPA